MPFTSSARTVRERFASSSWASSCGWSPRCRRGNRSISAALAGITAAVVGVIANLALYFTLHTIFAETTHAGWGPIDLELPRLDSIRPVSAVIAVLAALMIFSVKWSVLRTLGVCALLGLAAAPLGLPVG